MAAPVKRTALRYHGAKFRVYENGYTGTYTGLPIPAGSKARHFRPDDLKI